MFYSKQTALTGYRKRQIDNAELENLGETNFMASLEIEVDEPKKPVRDLLFPSTKMVAVT